MIEKWALGYPNSRMFFFFFRYEIGQGKYRAQTVEGKPNSTTINLPGQYEKQQPFPPLLPSSVACSRHFCQNTVVSR